MLNLAKNLIKTNIKIVTKLRNLTKQGKVLQATATGFEPTTT